MQNTQGRNNIKSLAIIVSGLLLLSTQTKIFAQIEKPSSDLELASETVITSSSISKTRVGKGNCYHGDEMVIKDETDPFEVNVGDGNLVKEVWIKAGSMNQDSDTFSACTLFTEDGNNGCYSVTGIGTQEAIVAKIGDGPNCKDISHIEVVDPPIEVEPVITPTAVPIIEPTLVPTSTPTPTDPPTQDSSDNDSNNNNSNSNSDVSNNESSSTAVAGGAKSEELIEQKRGQVLGASTLAKTGSAETGILFTTGLLGLSFVMMGVANEKRSK